jgi:hypothetical protein
MTRRDDPKSSPESDQTTLPPYELQSDPSWLGDVSFRADRGPVVPVTEGLTAFEWVDFSAQLHSLGFDASGRVILDDPPSRYAMHTFSVHRRDDGPPLTAHALRAVPVERIVNEVLHQYGVDDEAPPEESREAIDEIIGGGMSDDAALRFVARLYLRTSLQGGATGEALATWLACSRATVIRWVAAAKDAGYLKTADTRRR